MREFPTCSFYPFKYLVKYDLKTKIMCFHLRAEANLHFCNGPGSNILGPEVVRFLLQQQLMLREEHKSPHKQYIDKGISLCSSESLA
jgi:hypothetical protein